MKKRYWLALATILVALMLTITVMGVAATAVPSGPNAIQAGEVIINEFMADPAADITGDANGDGTRDGSEDEFVEIVNVSGGDLDISGWTVEDAVAVRHTFPAGSIIPDACSLVVFGGGTPTGAFGGSIVQTASGGYLGLNNSGDSITLTNLSAAAVATYTYGSEADVNQALTRDPDITGPEPLVAHSTAAGSSGALFSPGTMISGTAFVGCPSAVSIVKTVIPDTDVTPGGTVTYSIVVENGGDSAASGAALTDTLPAEADFTAWIISPTGTLISNDVITWTGIIPASDSLTWSFTAEVTGSLGSSVVNTATLNLDGVLSDAEAAFTFESGVLPPSVVINEIIQNPNAVYDSAGEWFELYNSTDSDIDIDGWTIKDEGIDSHVINNGGPLYVPAGGYLVLGNNTDTGTNGGVTVAYSYGSSWYLSNGDDEVVLLDDSLEEIDRVEYDGGTNWPDPTGASMSLEEPVLDNSVGANWCTSTTPYGDGDLGTPGAENSCAPPLEADLGLSKVVSLYYPGEGDTITYTLEVMNSADSTAEATNVVIKDYLPNTTTQVIYLDNTCGASVSGGVVTWNAGNIVTGTSVTCDIAVEVRVGTDGTHFDNLAEVFDSDLLDLDSTPGNMGAAPVEDDEDSATVWVGTDPVCGSAATYIHTIQGSGTSSPEDGNIHTIEGVVIGDYQDTDVELGGFFLQEEDADADADPMTSEGIFVNESGTEVHAGDIVRLTGTVNEYYDLTELTGVTTVTLCSTGNSVTPATVTLPILDTAEWEWVEGSLVTIPGELFVSETYDLGRYGEVMLSVNDRLYNPTNVVNPGTEANDLQDLNDRSYVVLNDANPNQNPDPVIYPSPELSATNTLRSGYTLPDLTAVVDYAYGIYRMQPVGPIAFTAANERTAAPDPVLAAPVFTGTLKVASFNVLNYFVTLDDSGAICGPTGGMDCRGADSAEEFARQRTKIINAIVAMDADVIGLMELENHPTDDALLDLVAGLNAEVGAGTYARIITGTIGTDAIKNAFIYKPGMVTPVGSPAILDSSVDPTFIDTKNRPVLAQTFMETATGEMFTAAVNHLKSKGSDCDALGDPDTGDGQGNCNLTRTSAAIAMVNWLATDPTGSGDRDFLIIGDLNSYAMEDPIMALQDGGYTNLVSAFNGLHAYSYIFDGQAGYLDHALVNGSMRRQVTGVTIWHINTDEPSVLDYNTNYKSPGQIISFYSDDPYRASDHDPIIVGLNLSVRSFYVPWMVNQ